MNFTEITKKMNEMFTKTGKVPVKVKVNSYWYEKQLQGNFVLHNPNENLIEKLTGLPTSIDNNVDTFEFVYES
jgi:hypothetical protein